ncbi:uncharacterized protein LOC132696669 [Cylas formicarius]|uniref:uncharacterized protein LOC132696669 n=1 Tax=Cylas formicarius TaxID=197179 RepID=UPI002958667C|nr:uncharacterized protein LOC132696669 [Cylas formicarius]
MMPVKINFVICLLVIYIDHKVLADIRDDISKLVESIREKIPETIHVNNVNLKIPEDSSHSGSFSVKDLTITGVKEFVFDMQYYWMIEYIPKAFELTLEKVQMTMDYECDIKMFKIPFLGLFGNGSMSYSVEDLKLNGSILPISSSGLFTLTSVILQIADTKASVGNLMEDDEFSTMVENLINDHFNVGKIVQNNQGIISERLTEIGNKIIQDLLHKSDLIINSVKQDSNFHNNMSKSFLPVFEEFVNQISNSL